MSKHSSSLPWESAKLHDEACCWERIEAPLPPLRSLQKCDFIPPRQLSPFPERLVLPFSNEVILSSYQEPDSSGNYLFTPWSKVSEREILVEHMMDIEKAIAQFREAYETRDTTSSHLKFQKTVCDPIDCAHEIQHLQLELWTPSGKRRCLRTTNCRKVACVRVC